MTPRPMTPQAEAGEIIQFPDAPPEELTAFDYINYPGYPPSLAEHFGNPDTTIIISEIAAALIPTRSYEGVLYPDLLIAFGVNPAARAPRNGYLIPEQGKPPDFVMEVASESTARRDETLKREAYAAMSVPEYWRFDPTGGRRYSTHLAGDRLVDGLYLPITIHRTDDEHLWGHSDSLNLDLCWEDGNLRFWDPVDRRYLHTFMEESAARREAEVRADEAEVRAAEAEARVRQLEEELRRRQDS
jgi:Uma2 family endonuclease